MTQGELLSTPPIRTLDSAWHPFEVLFLGFGLVVGFPLLWGAPAPGSTSALLSPWAQHVWGWLLVGGCFTALVGAVWQRWAWHGRGRAWAMISPTSGGGLGIEQAGLVGVGFGTAIYAVGVVIAAGAPGRFVAAGLVAGMGAACFTRFWQIQRWTKATIHDREGR